jgi:hypothetical protein
MSDVLKHSDVAVIKKNLPKKQLVLGQNAADERRIKDIAQWLDEENAIVTLQTIIATVTKVIYNEDDIPDPAGGIDVSHIGCIQVATPIIDFPITPANDWITPLDAQVRSYPIVGELVNIINYGGKTFYFQTINNNNSASHNIIAGLEKDATSTGMPNVEVVPAYLNYFDYTKNPRPVTQYPGDWALNGRNDQSIRLGIDYKQWDDLELNSYNAVIKMRISDESKASEAPAGTTRPEFIDADKASFYMTRDEELRYTVVPTVDGTTNLTTIGAAAIILDSDRIIFNTKESTTTGQIDIFSGNTVNIVSKLNTNIIGEVVKLGDTNDDNLQSAVLGESLVTFLAELIKTLDGFASRIAGLTGIGNVGGAVPVPDAMAAGNALGGWTSVLSNEQFIKNRILSKNVKISKTKRPGL